MKGSIDLEEMSRIGICTGSSYSVWVKLSNGQYGRPTMQMTSLTSNSAVRLTGLLLAIFAAAPLGHAQGMQAPGMARFNRHVERNDDPQPSQLPPTPPTAPLPPPMPIIPGPPPTTRAKHAVVTYENGLVNVRANDSSLNQILRSIPRETGLKITGGVEDQRVFGDYGPATTSQVLATLLDGTGTNILLTEGDAHTPGELVLTPRGGGPTPPSPNSAAEADPDEDRHADREEQQNPAPVQPMRSFAAGAMRRDMPAPPTSGPQSIPQPANNVLGSDQNSTPTASQIPTTNSVPLDAVPTPSTTTAGTGGQGIVDTPNPPAANSTTGTNAPSTADSIYQQLLKMQQQKQQQQQNPSAAPAAPSTPQ